MVYVKKRKIKTEVMEMSPENRNLDLLINKIGYEIVEEIKTKGNEKTKYKNEIEKALGVLSNDGVYAYYVYVKSRKIDDVFLKKIKPIVETHCSVSLQNDNWQEFFEKLSKDIYSLLFFREILDKILIYARYHAKAMGD